MYPLFIAFGILLLPKILSLFAPFILGLVIYLACRKTVRRLTALGFNRSLSSFFTLAFAVALILGAVAVLSALAYNERSRLPELYARLSAAKTEIPYLRNFIVKFKDELIEAVKTVSVKLLSCLQKIPEILMILFFSLLSAFFFLKDEEKIVDIIVQNGGSGFLKKVSEFKRIVSGALSGYFKAQIALMAITFGIISAALTLFGVRRGALIALGVAAVDAVPVFGTGCILLPWAAYEFIFGSGSLAFGLLAVYGVCSLIRQLLEPKIVGRHIGLPPIITLAGVYVGYKLLGVVGLIFGPVFALIFVTYIQKRA